MTSETSKQNSELPSVSIVLGTRPETVYAGANLVAGTDPLKVVRCALEMLARNTNWEQPYGDNVARKIMDIVCKEVRGTQYVN